MLTSGRLATYDSTGVVDYTDIFNEAGDAYLNLTVAAGDRVARRLVDGTARTGYSLINAKSRTAQALASEYYAFDWEYAQTPEQSSWIASSWVRTPSHAALSCASQREPTAVLSASARAVGHTDSCEPSSYSLTDANARASPTIGKQLHVQH